MSEIDKRIAGNVARIRQRIAAAADRSGRAPENIRLVAVTKYVGLDEILALVRAGCHDIGESRPQDLWRKAQAISDQPIRWHMIGHLQRNKARRTLPLVSLIHSGDNLRLLETLDQLSAERGRPASVLIEVNVSGDVSKHGFAPHELPALLPRLADLKHLRIGGLMAMAGLDAGAEQTRAEFSRLRELRFQLMPDCPPNISLDELSMGMSGDFEIAIEEGATIVRVGTALFEDLPEGRR
jgi:pyridoxal phosphate enzyme (YggS family)